MISVIEMFSGIGAFRKALQRQAVEHEVVGISEIDKYAIQSYNAIFGQTKNYGDISKVLKLDYADMWTYGFPCQDISVAGKQAGIKRDTRSGLLYQVQRLLETAYQYNELPKYLIMENVKNLVGKKFRKDFDSWLDYLDEIGYNNYWQVLNAKDYGIPQNRERVFCISIRKDIDKGEFKFPEKQELKLRLKDMLEEEVDEKYYLNDVQIDKIKSSNFAQEAKRIQEKEYCDTLLARDWKDPKCVQVGTLDIKGQDIIKRVYSSDGLSPTLTTMEGGNRQPKIVEEGFVDRKYKEFIDENGYVPELFNPYNKAEIKDVAPTQTTYCNSTTSSATVLKAEPTIIDDTQGFDGVRKYENYSPTLRAQRSGLKVAEPKIEKVDIPQMVKVRKYPVDTEKLKKVLREHKNITNTAIATTLNKPQTLVEHWFRNDDCFAIPDADIWFELKELLNIKTDEFDKSITEFEEREGIFEKSNRCYFENGISPTLTSASADEKIITQLKSKCKRLASLVEKTTFEEGQVLNMDLYNQTTNKDISQCLTEPHHNTQRLFDGYRIRKLTPKECWRLMGFDDIDFEKAQTTGVSNTQLYKQAGNSIVVNVLEEIIKNLGLKAYF